MDEMQHQEKHELQTAESAERTRTSTVYMPRVDIYEQDDTTVLVADMPGVDENSIDITLEKNVLTIRGFVEEPLQGYGLAYGEYGVGDYERTFALSDEVDRNKIEASMKDGVLRLTLPKAEEARSRKISVRTD
jgi:HSP20 family molecular chaperone IbpA